MGQEYNFASEVGTKAAGARQTLVAPLPFGHQCELLGNLPQPLLKTSESGVMQRVGNSRAFCR